MTKILSTLLALLTLVSGLFTNLNFNVNYYVYENVYYGTHERQCLDITIPGNYTGDLGLVLYVHGGAWIAGDKDSRLPFAKGTTKNKGYVSATMNYRFIDDETDCFDILDDIDAALQKIKDFCAERGINVTNFAFYASSAGAHLALLHAYSRKDTAPIPPAMVVSLCAPTDLTTDALYYDTVLGRPNRMAGLYSDLCGYEFTLSQKSSSAATKALLKASPISYVDYDTVPTLIAHGIVDAAISFSNASDLDKKLTQYGVIHDFIVYPNSGHSLDKDPASRAELNSMMNRYFKEYLGPSAFDAAPDQSSDEDIHTNEENPLSEISAAIEQISAQ